MGKRLQPPGFVLAIKRLSSKCSDCKLYLQLLLSCIYICINWCVILKLEFILKNGCLIAIFCKHFRCSNQKLVIVSFIVLLFHDSFLSTHNNEVTTTLIKLLMADGYSEDQSLMLSRQIYTKLKQTPDEAGWSPQYVDNNDEVGITSVEELP